MKVFVKDGYVKSVSNLEIVDELEKYLETSQIGDFEIESKVLHDIVSGAEETSVEVKYELRSKCESNFLRAYVSVLSKVGSSLSDGCVVIIDRLTQGKTVYFVGPGNHLRNFLKAASAKGQERSIASVKETYSLINSVIES